MTTLEKIKSPVADEIVRYEEYLRESLYSENRLAQEMLDFIFLNRGKAVRPLLVLLSASICKGDGEPLPRTSHMGAMLIEMIHTASLIHDDVIDDSALRRGKPSVNALWKSQRAILIGDYILAQSYNVGMKSGAYPIVEYISNCMPMLCEGELIQSEQSDRLEMTRAIYNDIIYKKTATLIGTSCGAGAMSVGADEQQIAQMRQMGDAIGMAFQIKDDILDYQPACLTGKPVCSDLRERKITLPLLSVLEASTTGERAEIMELLSEVRVRPENVEALYDIVLQRGGLQMASEVMNGYVDRAIDLLHSFPPSRYRQSLSDLFLYIASRER